AYRFVLGRAVTAAVPVNTGGSIDHCDVLGPHALPDGLSQSATCAITGVPTALSAQTTYTLGAAFDGGDAGVVNVPVAVEVVDPIHFQVPSITIRASASAFFDFTALDGIPPYTYDVTAGPGFIDRLSGRYYADGHAGISRVTATDATGDTVEAQVSNVPVR